MAPQRQLTGLNFKKLDLHVHTPASTCFRGNCTPDELVNAALDRGLAGIAITDHNTGEWIDRVIDAAKGKPITIFPGVEITCTGGKSSIHIVGLFDITKRAKHVEFVLNKLEIRPEDYGKQEALTNKSPIEVIEIIHNSGGIAVLAHANSSKGVMHDMSGEPRTRIIQCPYLLAVEGTDFQDEDKRKKLRRVIDLLNGTDTTYQRKLAVYQASDNPCPDGSGQHCLEGIGTRCTYFKLEQVNLEGLRQCFIDPDVRIRQDFELTSLDYPHIKDVTISSGFLDGQIVEFHKGLTTILGAKGAGKSLLIEFIRFALNQEPGHASILNDHKGKLNTRLGEYGVVTITFVDETGKEFHISRTYRQLDGSPYNNSISYDPAQIFPVLFLSQNEIIKIAEEEDEQLAFIDRFFDFRSFRSKIDSYERELERLDKKMAEGLRAYSEVEELNGKIGTLQTEINKIDEALKHPVFERFKQLELKERILSTQNAYISSMVDSVEEAKNKILNTLTPDIPDALARDPALQRNRDLIERAREILANQFLNLVDNLGKEKQKAEQEYKAWHPSYLSGKKEYDDYIQTMGGDYKGLALSRERAVRQLTELQRTRDIAEKKKNEVPTVSNRRNELLDALQKESQRYTDERRAKCEKFQNDSAGKLKLRILDSSNVDEFRNTLSSLKRGSYLRNDEVDIICSHLNPRDFVIHLLRYDATKETRHLEKLAKDATISLGRMKTLADFLLSTIAYEDLLALQYKALPQDRPEILYNIGDGDYQPLTSISVGQKCTAMLIMALSDGTMPIIIDQPEDSLDIRSIWEDMCSKLRIGKERRQFIFTTHNSSLAVASDTDCYVIMEGTASHGKVVYMGSMDHQPINVEVLKYLEGGRDTYRMKYAKYGGERNL